MRSVVDDRGRTWQAALLDGSYGNVRLVFSPLHGADVRQLLLGAETWLEAEAWLAALDEAGLRQQLAAALPWDAVAGS
ncbi:MAG TPA: hypothetical protein VFN09_05550 [Rhodanobacteraceae bacterium]|nr:hypothetical protein [Rhodanobacteraceae bacterium]